MVIDIIVIINMCFDWFALLNILNVILYIKLYVIDLIKYDG